MVALRPRDGPADAYRSLLKEPAMKQLAATLALAARPTDRALTGASPHSLVLAVTGGLHGGTIAAVPASPQTCLHQ